MSQVACGKVVDSWHIQGTQSEAQSGKGDSRSAMKGTERAASSSPLSVVRFLLYNSQGNGLDVRVHGIAEQRRRAIGSCGKQANWRSRIEAKTARFWQQESIRPACQRARALGFTIARPTSVRVTGRPS